MPYTVGNYEFQSKNRYEAAKRDFDKISRLKKKGRSETEIAENYRRQILRRHILFETIVGLDFIREQNDLLHINEDAAYLYMLPGGGLEDQRPEDEGLPGEMKGRPGSEEDDLDARFARAFPNLDKNGRILPSGNRAGNRTQRWQGSRKGSGSLPAANMIHDINRDAGRTSPSGIYGTGRAYQKARIKRRRVPRPLEVTPSRIGMLFRRVSIAILGAAFLFVLFVFLFQIYSDRRSRQNIESVQRLYLGAEASAAGTSAEPLQAAGTAAEPLSHDLIDESRILAQYRELYSLNHDLAGWLRIPDTKIDYPVMYLSGDNDYYLAHDYYGNEDKNGLLVMDKRCYRDGFGSHLLIHGHNMKSGFMFGSLKYYKSRDYYRQHSQVFFDTLYEERVYDIIAVFISSINEADTESFEYYNFIQINSETDFNNYVTEVRDQSLYDIPADVSFGDELLTLSTCDYTREDGRLVIVAARRMH